MTASPSAFTGPGEGAGSQAVASISLSSDSCSVRHQGGGRERGAEGGDKFNCHVASGPGPCGADTCGKIRKDLKPKAVSSPFPRRPAPSPSHRHGHFSVAAAALKSSQLSLRP